jgi:polyisoprenoid-binding protein YceI
MNKLLTLFFITFLVYFEADCQKIIDRTGYIKFFSSAPLEDIEALNEKAMSVLDTETGKIAVTMQMTDFNFKKSLMQEHFNENYIESEKYPKSTFLGSLTNFDFKKIVEGKITQLTAEGSITIHGQTKPLIAEVTFSINKNFLTATTVFKLKVADFGIKIPTVVVMNIAEEVEVTNIFNYDLNSK